jgi:hypothetical protein
MNGYCFLIKKHEESQEKTKFLDREKKQECVTSRNNKKERKSYHNSFTA